MSFRKVFVFAQSYVRLNPKFSDVLPTSLYSDKIDSFEHASFPFVVDFTYRAIPYRVFLNPEKYSWFLEDRCKYMFLHSSIFKGTGTLDMMTVTTKYPGIKSVLIHTASKILIHDPCILPSVSEKNERGIGIITLKLTSAYQLEDIENKCFIKQITLKLNRSITNTMFDFLATQISQFTNLEVLKFDPNRDSIPTSDYTEFFKNAAQLPRLRRVWAILYPGESLLDGHNIKAIQELPETLQSCQIFVHGFQTKLVPNQIELPQVTHLSAYNVALVLRKVKFPRLAYLSECQPEKGVDSAEIDCVEYKTNLMEHVEWFVNYNKDTVVSHSISTALTRIPSIPVFENVTTLAMGCALQSGIIVLLSLCPNVKCVELHSGIPQKAYCCKEIDRNAFTFFSKCRKILPFGDLDFRNAEVRDKVLKRVVTDNDSSIYLEIAQKPLEYLTGTLFTSISPNSSERRMMSLIATIQAVCKELLIPGRYQNLKYLILDTYVGYEAYTELHRLMKHHPTLKQVALCYLNPKLLNDITCTYLDSRSRNGNFDEFHYQLLQHSRYQEGYRRRENGDGDWVKIYNRYKRIFDVEGAKKSYLRPRENPKLDNLSRSFSSKEGSVVEYRDAMSSWYKHTYGGGWIL